jgi:hypothetical protein
VPNTTKIPQHPAKFSDPILVVINEVLAAESKRQGRLLRVLDPMAGVGRIHELDRQYVSETIGVEIETEWAMAHPGTEQGDATALRWPDGAFSVTISSPPYANRMADSFNARDNSRRITYKHLLGRDLTPGSGARLQWGNAYREWASRVLDEMIRVTEEGGLVCINISNHIRNFKEQPVSEWWRDKMIASGLKLEKSIPIRTSRMRFGENNAARVKNEWLFVMRKPLNKTKESRSK